MSDDLYGPIQGCVLVSFTINQNLVNLNGPGVQFQWLPDAEPKLDILSGVRFIHTVWFQIAQAVCRV